MSRRLLFIAFFFPPIGGVSVPRTLGHVRHLPDHGWDVTVVTPRHSAYHLQDPGLLSSVPAGTRSIRTMIIEPAGMKRAVRRVLGLNVRPGYGTADADVDAAAVTGPRSPLERLRRLLFFPDDQVGWVPFAILAGIRQHRREPVAAVLSSSSPVSAHLAAGLIARVTGVPWIAEFRDPWVGNALAHPAPWMQRVLARRIERWIVGTAERCVFVTPSLTELYRRRYPSRADRFSTVTNAYDLRSAGADQPARPLEPAVDGPGVSIVYAGTLDRPAELAIFLDGLRRYRAWQADRPVIRVEFLGHATDACRKLIAAAREDLGRDVISHAGFVPRAEARRRLDQADGALLLLGEGPGMGLFIGGKLYEYLGADRPIFAMLPQGDARDLLTDIGWGTIASPSAQSVADALHRFVIERDRRSVADPERKFERGRVVARLGAVLDDAVTSDVRR